MMVPLFLGAIVAIMWLSGALLAQDLRAYRAAEIRVRRCPRHL